MVKFVTTLSSKLNELSQRIIKVNSMGIGNTQTPLQANPHGLDSHPVKGMIAIYAPSQGMGETVIIGYLSRDQIAEIGETRVYSTDKDGVLKASIHLKNDETIEINGNSDNMVRFSELETAFNQLKTDFNAHSHITTATVGATPTPGVIAPPTAPSSADISGAKIDKIKTS